MVLMAVAGGLQAQEIKPRLSFVAHTGLACNAIITPDGATLITRGAECLRDRELVGANDWKMWDLVTGAERVISTDPCQALALSPDGAVLAVAEDRVVRLRALATDRELRVLTDPGGKVAALAFSPDGTTVATGTTKPSETPGGNDAVATLWSVASGKPVRTLEPSPGPMRALAFSPDGRLLAVATQDFPMIGQVTLWDLETGKVRSTIEANGVDCLAFSPDGSRVAAGCVANRRGGKSEGHHVRLWEVETGKDLYSLKCEGRVYTVAFAPDGRTVAAGSDYAELKFWDVATGELRLALPTQSDMVFSITYSKDGRTFVSTTRDGFVRCWDAAALRAEKPGP